MQLLQIVTVTGQTFKACPRFDTLESKSQDEYFMSNKCAFSALLNMYAILFCQLCRGNLSTETPNERCFH